MPTYASRSGRKLQAALAAFAIDPTGIVCADLGSNAGGFVDCLLQHGAKLVYAIDTGYGMLDWKLRNDPRVVVMERTNAMHVTLPRPVDLVTIDVAWTKQKHILPAAAKLLAAGGLIVTLIKPHYEADPALLRRGVLPPQQSAAVVQDVLAHIRASGLEVIATTPSPIKGAGGNIEVLAAVRPGTPLRPPSG
jgi:23S rRNA (cytidine1920-2'-O)/16S rRNA (cytidine1409-2'-O)-methyltransferase